MKRTVRIAWLALFFCVLAGMFASADYDVPAWEKYAPSGGQLDDTGYEDIRAWLLVPGNRESVLPYSGGSEVLASTIVANARSLVGKYPYVYGGESPEEGGFDCTGLVWYVYNRMSGLNITLSQAGRSKAALAAAGEKIYDHDAFLPGDVIQFTYAHVAIYVGDGRVVHARTTGTMIQETDLNYGNVEYAVRYPSVVQSTVLASGTCGEGISWTLRTNGTMSITGSGAMKDYGEETAVPWYEYRAQMDGVVIAETVTSVGDYAFYGCENLESVSAPGIETIGFASFYDCGALVDLVLSDCVTEIGRWAFCRCVGLKALTLPEALVSIESNAFYGCSGLVSLSFPESLTLLGDCAFENCSSLRSITIPEGVTRIGESTFFGCLALTSVGIPKTVTRIGDWAFAYCDALSEVVYAGLPAQWEEIIVGESNEPLLSAKRICTGVPDAPVVQLSLDKAVHLVILEWNEIKYAEAYEIWRMVGDGTFVLVGKVEGTLYCDLNYIPGSFHFYVVRAVSGENEGKWSEVVVVHEARKASGVPPC